ncbi:glycosyltransferase family 1 protein [Reichenbachiella sp. MSK19-1]|uniref:glycosyltransferase family 4 protein n=1 Tax=Reichenbachiella sp. MSK19-1 TaxID=1897631 RepID=UPI000E6BE39A|nr:glycosyltransferase family 1 protein [Reichenbachiella sp. MSK19-1]RJE71718.1 hypothetical protein BGP76_06420 [Reichenbachiella sp. MSK19-1]
MNSKKVLIDCTLCCGRISGVERYTIEVVNRLIQLNSEKYIIVLPKRYIGIKVDENRRKNVFISWSNNRLINEWIFLPLVYLISRTKIVFFPGFPPSAFFLFVKAKLVRTVYDVVVWKFANTISFKTKYYTKLLETLFVKRHDLIFTISENAKKLINKEFPEISSPIINTYLGVSFDSVRIDCSIDNFTKKSRFILSVGTLEPRKNFPFLIKAFSQVITLLPDVRLVIAGRNGWGSDEVDQTIEKYGVKESVILAGAVTDAELNKLYNDCEFFVYPSIYEGFGLPVIEAFSKNKFVISSNRASLPEVVGEAGVLLDIENAENWTSTIVDYLNNPSLKDDYLMNIDDQLKKFNWSCVSQQIHKELNRL